MSLRRPDLSSSRGASVVEYAFLVSGLAAVIVLAVFGVGRVAAAQIAKGGTCLTSSVCPAAPVALPSSSPSATATAPAAPVITATPTPTPTRTSGSGGNDGNNGNNGGKNGNGNNRDD